MAGLRDASRIYYFEDQALTKYRARAQQHLNTIIDDLADSADSHLGMARRKWAPADDVMVDFLVMEGPLVPTIQIRVSHVVSEEAGGVESEDSQYKPFMWVGIAMFNQAGNTNCADNPNCGFLGSTVEPRLYGFDPIVQDEDADPGDDFDINDSTEFLGGEIYGGGFGQNARVVAAYGGELANRLISWGSGLFLFPVDPFLISEGNFNGQNYTLLDRSLKSRSGMIACEGPLAQVTAPPEAWTDIDDDRYWQRSIVLDPDGFLIGEDTVGSSNQIFGSMCVSREGEVGTPCNHRYNYRVNINDPATIPAQVQAGIYEISCFTESFECECVTGDVHIRLVLGKSSTSLKRIEGEDGSISYDAGTGGGKVQVVDIFPETIGDNDEMARFFFRDLMLGGLPPCLEDDRNAFGGNPRSLGWWDQAIRVNVQAGTFELAPPTIRKPFFEQGGACGDTQSAGECSSACIGCTGNDITDSDGIRVPYPAPNCQTIEDDEGVLSTIDLMGGVLWHMARVWQVDSQGCICWIKLVGNDGAQGSCGVNPWAYQHTEQAIGVHISGNLFTPGDDPTNLGGGTGEPSCDGGWSVGQLVTVIGSTGPCNPCGVGGIRRLVVTEPRTADNDFTSLFWSQLRCGDAEPVQRFWRVARDAMKNFGVTCIGGGTPVQNRTLIEFHPDLAAGDEPKGTLTVTPG